jgi:GTP-binding protein EngB required for normal cell division
MFSYLVFTGRPNAGKSSIIKGLFGFDLPTGKRPGTTRMITKIPLSKKLFLVDMPGYGRISKASKFMEEMTKDKILDFLESSAENIALTIHVLDISTFLEVTSRLERKGFESLDLEMIRFLAEKTGIIPLIAANKIDKSGKKLEKSVTELKIQVETILQSSDQCIIPVSARTGEGLGALKAAIHSSLTKRGHRTPFKHSSKR